MAGHAQMCNQVLVSCVAADALVPNHQIQYVLYMYQISFVKVNYFGSELTWDLKLP